MANDNFTRINTYMPDSLSGQYCFQRFDVPTKALQAAFSANVPSGSQPSPEHFQRMIMTDKPGLTVANIPITAPLQSYFSQDKNYGKMLDKLSDAGLLIPVNTSPPIVSAKGPGTNAAVGANIGMRS